MRMRVGFEFEFFSSAQHFERRRGSGWGPLRDWKLDIQAMSIN
jgi:hypothetical protein